jgi:hypothetical protein
MANRTAWTAGNGVGLTWTTAINGSDLASLANGSTVLSSVADIANGTNLDMYAMVGIEMTVASATPPAGAYLGLYLMPLNEDGSSYGTGEMSSGGTISRAPASGLVGSVALETAAAATLLAGVIPKIELPPCSFRFALYNGSGAALSATAANCVVKYQTYNLNLNN